MFDWFRRHDVTQTGQVVSLEPALGNPVPARQSRPDTETVPEVTPAATAGLTESCDGGVNGPNPPDAFEVAILDAETFEPLVGATTGLGDTDAFLNIQGTGEVFFGRPVTVSGVAESGQAAVLEFPLTVTVDVSAVPAGTHSRLYFDLLGFGDVDSSVVFDDVILAGDGPSLLSARLDPESDSGTTGDGVTNLPTITLVGTTDPGQDVLLDQDGDGYDDGSITADGTGRFVFENVALTEGANRLRMQATNEHGTSEFATTIALDTQAPTGSLVAPVLHL